MKKQRIPSKTVTKSRRTKGKNLGFGVRVRTNSFYKYKVKQDIKRVNYKYESKQEYKSSARERLRKVIYYHEKKINAYVDILTRQKTIPPRDKRRIIQTVSDMVNATKEVYKRGYASNEYINCIREKFNEINLFFKRMESVGWSVGKFIRNYDFDDDFLPEKDFDVGSLKIIDAIGNMQDYTRGCDIFISKKG